jgi:hypothetical protein
VRGTRSAATACKATSGGIPQPDRGIFLSAFCQLRPESCVNASPPRSRQAGGEDRRTYEEPNADEGEHGAEDPNEHRVAKNDLE